MPTYEYECEKCEAQGEHFGHFSECNGPFPDCVECGGKTKRAFFTAPAGKVEFPAAGGGGYVSPASGKWIDSSSKRKQDFKETKTRPWEGMEQEQKEADKRKKHEEAKEDAKLEDTVRKAYHQLPPEKRKTLTNPK